MTADTVITFRDLHSSFSLYRTYEENQMHVYDLFDITKKYVYVLHTYHPGEFAAEFISVAKKTRGHLMLIEPYSHRKELVLSYEVYLKEGNVHIEYMC